MGFEYSIRFQYDHPASVEKLLLQLSMVRGTRSAGIEFELRSADNNTVSMPDASMRIEPYGIYYCSYGGVGWEYLGTVIARLVEHFGAVTVTQLE